MKKTINDYKKIIKTLGLEPKKEQQISLHYDRQATNQMQISYITEKKIHGILENVGISINPKKAEDRAKFFIATKPSKFFNTLVNDDKIHSPLVEGLRDKFVKDMQSSVKLSVKMYEAKDIPTLYNMQKDQENDNGNMTFLSQRMSCMQGKPKSYFEVYANTKGLKMAVLEDKNGNMYGRSLLWFADGEHYLDRIYIADALSGSDEVRGVYQHQVWNEVCTKLNKTINCYSAPHFKSLITQDEVGSQPLEDFNPVLIADYTALDYEHYPYADTFQGLDGIDWSKDDTSGEVYLCNTDGSNANDDSCCCDNCGDRVNEDDACYSDYDEATYCEGCSVYCEDHETHILEGDAVHNSHTGENHHRDDLNL